MFDALEKMFKNDKETDVSDDRVLYLFYSYTSCCSQNDLINKLYQGELQDYVKCLEVSTHLCAY